MKRRWWIVLVVLGLTGVGGVVAFPFVVRWIAAAEAAERGFTLDAGTVSLGWGVIWLSDVEVKSRRVAGFSARLQHIEVELGSAGATRVQIHGGLAKLSGPRSSLRDLMAGGGGASAGEARAGPDRVRVDGLTVLWEVSPDESYALWGVRTFREGSQRRLSADLVRLRHPAAQAEAVEVQSLLAGTSVVEVSTGKAIVDVHVDAAGSTDTRSSADPSLPDRPPRNVLAALVGRDGKRAERVRGRLERVTGLIARRLPEGSALKLDGVTLRLHRGSGSVSLGPARFEANREADAVLLSFVPGFSATAEQRLEFGARLALDGGDSQVEVSGGPVQLAAMGIREGEMGLADVGTTELRVQAKVVLAAGATQVQFESTGELAKLALSHRAFGPEPLRGLSVSWRGRGSMHTDGSRFQVADAEVRVGAVKVQVAADIEHDVEGLRVDTRAEVPVASCQQMFDSLPRTLIPMVGDTRLGGTFSWKASVKLNTARLADMDLSWRMQNDCRFEKVPEDLSPQRFKFPFTRMVPDGDGAPLIVISGPGSPNWAPIRLVSRFLEAGVLVAEDGRFWSHRGFDQRAIESSIRQNVRAGRFIRGASTVSMQLAKNLYLTRDKTLSRKIQEALLTMLLEQELRKDEILELYLNVVEFGPGIFGVKQAAEYYFRSDPGELSVAQSFFLASILPNPKQQHFDDQGYLKERWARYVRRLMRIAQERGHISEYDLQRGLEEELRFGVPHQDQGLQEVPENGFEPYYDDAVPF